MKAEHYFNQKQQDVKLGAEIEVPHHDCYACNDSGFVRPHDFYFGELLDAINQAKIGIACTCAAGSGKLESGAVRFDEVNFETVRQVSENYRQEWQDWARAKADGSFDSSVLANLSRDILGDLLSNTKTMGNPKSPRSPKPVQQIPADEPDPYQDF